MKKSVGLFILGMFIIFVVLKIVKTPPKLDLSQTVQTMNAQLKPPVEITKGLRLDSITAVGASIVVKYTALNYSGFDLPEKVNQILRVSMTQGMCNSVMNQPDQVMNYLVEQHVSFSAKFYNSTGMILSTFDAKPEDCR